MMKLIELLDVTQYDKMVSVNDINGTHIASVFAEVTRVWEDIAPYLDSEVVVVSTTTNLSLYVEIKEILK